ncbi:hypothetical protein ACFPYI_00555 [Halomarina salina]|uniref:Uncharacterized protein n=1 Tax=Halomarina salina TaxID=1872699 RepID=A0ABD5RH88_9EURY|nr:hypothetical protein [Halomarina salina]
MVQPFVVGCQNCEYQRTVATLDTALELYGEHRDSNDHSAEVWSRRYLADLDEDAPDYMPSLDTTDNAPSPDPTASAGGNAKAVDTDD